MDATPFLSAAAVAQALLADDRVAAAWDEPSALAEYRVSGLAGHLARSVLNVERYLDAVEAPLVHTDAAGYFDRVLADHDPVTSDLHREVRRASVEEAADGHAALVERHGAALDRLGARLAAVAADDPVTVRDGITLTVTEYLDTRLVEVVLHVDDLAVSVGIDDGHGLDASVLEDTAAILARIAARRHGALATVRGLARRERHPDPVRAL